MKILLELYLTFFKIGAFTFGGGYAMLPLLERELVDKYINILWKKKKGKFGRNNCIFGLYHSINNNHYYYCKFFKRIFPFINNPTRLCWN